MVREEFENEELDNHESSDEFFETGESDSIYIDQGFSSVPVVSGCTYVYLPDGSLTCAELLVSSPGAASAAPREESEELAQDSSFEGSNQELDASDPSEADEEVSELSLLSEISESFSSFSESFALFSSSSEEVNTSIDSHLANIDLFIGSFFSLWFIGWVWAQLNNWRRNV